MPVREGLAQTGGRSGHAEEGLHELTTPLVRTTMNCRNPCKHWVPGAGLEPARSEEPGGLSHRDAVTPGALETGAVRFCRR